MRPNGAGRISRISPGGTNGGGGKRIKGGGGPINGGGKNGGGGKRPIKGKVGASICNGEGAPTISSPTPVEATFDPKKSSIVETISLLLVSSSSFKAASADARLPFSSTSPLSTFKTFLRGNILNHARRFQQCSSAGVTENENL
ncbi:hypothetical protein GQX74_002359 [Glossina fuscipes]|nr:hypothetical protein GQX74_002359 [Glossina fuscipes]